MLNKRIILFGSSYADEARTLFAAMTVQPDTQRKKVNPLQTAGTSSLRQLAIFHMGTQLNATDITNLYAILNTYLAAIGAA